jgi:hypothetical protein
VPEGVDDGQVLRLKGKGAAGARGGEAGDSLVEIKVRPHKSFRRQGGDILLELPITLDEAVLGARIEVPTAGGRVQLTIPKGTSSGTVFRLRGKGARSTATIRAARSRPGVRPALPSGDVSFVRAHSRPRARPLTNPLAPRTIAATTKPSSRSSIAFGLKSPISDP